MRKLTNLRHVLLRGASKSAVLLVILFLVFSPFGQVLQTPTAYAADSEAACTARGGYWKLTTPGIVTGEHACYSGTNSLLPEGSSDTSKFANKGQDPLCNSIASCMLLPVYAFTVGLGSFVAAVGAYFFNLSAQLTLSSTAYALGFITDGWKAVRDIANMAFILILIYIAVNVMLQAETAKTMQTLAGVIFIALIINFSFFLTRVVIDTGNIAAVQVYNAIPNVVTDGAGSSTKPGVKDLTASIMNAVGVHKLLGTAAFDKFQDNTSGVTEFITLLIIYLMMGAMYFILAAAFVSVGIKFVFRIAILWLTIIASPLALIARVTPGLKSRYGAWQDMLISHAFYPLVFLFIFWIIVKFADGLNISQALVNYITNSQIPDAKGSGIYQLAGLIGDISIRLGFIVIMLFLGMRAADRIGVFGASAANWATSKVPGFGGLRSYARVGGNVSNRFGPGAIAGKLDNRLSNSPFGYSGIGSGLRKYVTKPVADLKVGGAESRTQLTDRWKKEASERELGLANVQAKKDARRLGELNKQWGKEQEDELKNLQRVGSFSSLSNPNKKRLDDLEAIDTERKVLSKRVEGMSNAQIASLKAADIEGIIKQVSESQVKAIRESGKHTTDAVKSLERKWHEENDKAPVGKVKEELKKLDKIHGTLQTLGYGIDSIAKRSGGNVVTLDNAKKALEEFEDKKEALQAEKEGAPREERKNIQQGINALNKAIKKTESVVEQLKKVPEDVGNRRAPGEFEISKP